MANQTVAFGLRPIGKVGQNDDNQGLSEYSIAASSVMLCTKTTLSQAAATGYIVVTATSTATILGSLNGIYYTDANTSKPTWANNLKAANTATDIVGFVSDDPYERFEIQSDNTAASAQTDIFQLCATLHTRPEIQQTIYQELSWITTR